MSDTFFSYWRLIQSANEDPAEYCLRPLSRAASVTSLSPKKNSPKPSLVVIDRSESPPSAPVTSLYPPLPRDPSLADMPLSYETPGEKANLEEKSCREQAVLLKELQGTNGHSNFKIYFKSND